MTKEIKPIGTSSIQGPTKSSIANKDIEDLFKSLSEKRAEIRNKLYGFSEKNNPDKKEEEIIRIKNGKYILTVNAYSFTVGSELPKEERIGFDNVNLDVNISIGKANQKPLSKKEEEFLNSYKPRLVLFNHETQLMSRASISKPSRDKIEFTLPSFFCKLVAPKDLANSLEQVVPCKWFEDILTERGAHRTPTYYSIIELNEPINLNMWKK